MSSENDQSIVAAERAVAFHPLAPTARQQTEPLVEMARDLGRVHRRGARRRELERERDAVEPAAHLGDRCSIVRVELEAGSYRPDALDEEPHRVRTVHRVEVGAGVGHTE